MDPDPQLLVLMEVASVIATQVPPKTSMRQIIAFGLVALQASKEEPRSFKELMAMKPRLLGESVRSSFFSTFAMPTPENPDALGWVVLTEHEKRLGDRVICLTERGKEVVNMIREPLSKFVNDSAQSSTALRSSS